MRANKRITIIGSGRSGMAAAKTAKRLGADVFVSDLAAAEHRQKEIAELRSLDVECEFGQHSERILQTDMVVISPGVPRTHEIFAKIADKRIPIYSELEFASWFVKAPIVAVTGTNGKTTTTTLIGEIMKTAGKGVLVAGNIGSALADHLDESFDVVVVEVSSFQAEGMDTFRPRVGALLNLSPDHMDRYDSEQSYYQAKRKMFERQESTDWIVYNHDDTRVRDLMEGLQAQRMPFSLVSELSRGCFVEANRIVLADEGRRIDVCPVSEVGIRGQHNVANSLAATAVAYVAGIPVVSIASALRSFRGVSHRLEFVRELAAVSYYNDSKATNVDSSRTALAAFDGKVIYWIAGGRHKGAPYTPLTELVRARVKKILLIGEAAPLIGHDLGKEAATQTCSSLREAVETARREADPGNVVLLSPACASYDMFRDYEDRGNQFKEIVRQLT